MSKGTRNEQTWKEKLESQPLWTVGGIILTTWGVAWACFSYLHSPSPKALECRVDGIESLNQLHHGRVSVLHEELMRLEETYSTGDPFVRDRAKGSADRVRADIKAEDSFYEKNLNKLMAKCISR